MTDEKMTPEEEANLRELNGYLEGYSKRTGNIFIFFTFPQGEGIRNVHMSTNIAQKEVIPEFLRDQADQKGRELALERRSGIFSPSGKEYTIPNGAQNEE